MKELPREIYFNAFERFPDERSVPVCETTHQAYITTSLLRGIQRVLRSVTQTDDVHLAVALRERTLEEIAMHKEAGFVSDTCLPLLICEYQNVSLMALRVQGTPVRTVGTEPTTEACEEALRKSYQGYAYHAAQARNAPFCAFVAVQPNDILERYTATDFTIGVNLKPTANLASVASELGSGFYEWLLVNETGLFE